MSEVRRVASESSRSAITRNRRRTRENLGKKPAKRLSKAVDRGLSGRHKGVKIIHGHGRSTGRSLIYRKAVDLLRKLANQTGGRLVQDNGNPGAHILWLNR